MSPELFEGARARGRKILYSLFRTVYNKQGRGQGEGRYSLVNLEQVTIKEERYSLVYSEQVTINKIHATMTFLSTGQR